MDIGLAIYVAVNILVIAGYFAAGVVIVKRMPELSRSGSWGGLIFFVGCAYTHIHLLSHVVSGDAITLAIFGGFWHILPHVAQAVGIWLFITEVYRIIVENQRLKSVSYLKSKVG